MGRDKTLTLTDVFYKVKKELTSELINQNETIWTYEELAKQLGYKVNSIQTFVSLKKIPHHRANGKVYFLKGEIINWIKNDGNLTIQQQEL